LGLSGEPTAAGHREGGGEGGYTASAAGGDGGGLAGKEGRWRPEGSWGGGGREEGDASRKNVGVARYPYSPIVR
jgi:hypothetical protein